MMSFFTKSAVWQLVIQSDLVSKGILLGLFFLSVVCCAIIAYKWMYFRQQRMAMDTFLARIKNAKTLDDMLAAGKEQPLSIGGSFILEMTTELKRIMELSSSGSLGSASSLVRQGTLPQQDFEYLETVGQQLLEQFLTKEEQHMYVLGTSAAASPLIGLFGTVWGLIHSFISISQEKTADIAVVAPGIAEALITTLAGLVVAIPALIFFHYFTQCIRSSEQHLMVVFDTFFMVTKRNFNS